MRWVVQRGDITKEDAQSVVDLIDQADPHGEAIVKRRTAAPLCQDFSRITDGPGHQGERGGLFLTTKAASEFQLDGLSLMGSRRDDCPCLRQLLRPRTTTNALRPSQPEARRKEAMMQDDTGRLLIPPPKVKEQLHDMSADYTAMDGLDDRTRPLGYSLWLWPLSTPKQRPAPTPHL